MRAIFFFFFAFYVQYAGMIKRKNTTLCLTLIVRFLLQIVTLAKSDKDRTGVVFKPFYIDMLYYNIIHVRELFARQSAFKTDWIKMILWTIEKHEMKNEFLKPWALCKELINSHSHMFEIQVFFGGTVLQMKLESFFDNSLRVKVTSHVICITKPNKILCMNYRKLTFIQT